jgi:hypothetical protein
LGEPSICANYQQLGKELEKTERERIVEELVHTEKEWKQIKEVMVEAAEQTVGYQPKQDNGGWFDEECKVAVHEKNTAYKRWIEKTN